MAAKPFGAVIMVEVEVPKESKMDKKEGGMLYIPDEAKASFDSATMTGFIRDIGSRYCKGHPILAEDDPDNPKIGDRVFFNRYGGKDLKVNGVKYKFLRDDCILGTLAPEDEVELF